MSKHTVASVLFSYESTKSGKTVQGLKIMPASQYEAYQWFSQESLRFLAVYSALGPDGTVAVLKGFTEGTEYSGSDLFEYSEYKGHKLLALKANPTDKKPVRFGAGKAKALLSIITDLGIKQFAALCQQVAGDATVSEYSPVKGKSKSAPKGGKGRRGSGTVAKAEEAAEIEEAGLSLPKGLQNQLLNMLPKAETVQAPAAGTTLDALRAEEQQLLMRLMMVQNRIQMAQAVMV